MYSENEYSKVSQIIVVLLLLSIPFLVYFGSKTESEKEIQGEVVKVWARGDDTGNHFYLRVKLDSGRIINIKNTAGRSSAAIGKKVLVLERKNLLGNPMYTIKRWYGIH